MNTGRTSNVTSGQREPLDDVSRILRNAFSLHQTGQLNEAESLYQQVLQRMPKHPDALHLLGLIARQQGNHARAIELISEAARLNPVAPIYFNLGNTYQQAGMLDEAISCYQQALRLNPKHAESLSNLGAVFQQQGKLEEAINSFTRALQIKPDSAEIYSNLGDVLRENMQFDTAIECIRNALRIKPDLSNAYLNLGRVYQDTANPQTAMENFQKALTITPDHVETLVSLSAAYQDNGQFSKAEEALMRVLELEPEHPNAWAGLAALKKNTQLDQSWVEHAVKILDNPLKPKDRVHLLYALGKHYDDLGEYKKAFPCFEQANSLQKSISAEFNQNEFANAIDAIISAYPAEELRKPRTSASTSTRPLFILGMPRSGTSLTEQILASHPDIFGAGELLFWNQKANTPKLDLMSWRDDPEQLEQLTHEYDAELDRHSDSAMRVVNKLPHNFLNIGMILTAFPNARILHTQRNPADTCLSIYFQGFAGLHLYGNDLQDLAFYYKQYLKLMQHWRETLPAETFMEVPYESLVENQVLWSQKIIEFTGLEWDERCLEFHNTERRVGTSSNWQVRQKIYKTSTERWRNYQEFIGPLLTLLE